VFSVRFSEVPFRFIRSQMSPLPLGHLQESPTCLPLPPMNPFCFFFQDLLLPLTYFDPPFLRTFFAISFLPLLATSSSYMVQAYKFRRPSPTFTLCALSPPLPSAGHRVLPFDFVLGIKRALLFLSPRSFFFQFPSPSLPPFLALGRFFCSPTPF